MDAKVSDEWVTVTTQVPARYFYFMPPLYMMATSPTFDAERELSWWRILAALQRERGK